MPAVANKTIEKLEIAKDKFSEAIMMEEKSKDNAILKAQEYVLTLTGYLETMQQRMRAKVEEMQKLKKDLLAKQSIGETAELPAFGEEGETRAMIAVRAKSVSTKTRQRIIEQAKIIEGIDAFKELLKQIQEHLTNFDLAMVNYLIRIGNKYKFLILADEDAVCLPELKGKLDREIPEEIGNLRSDWEYFNSLENDLMEAIMGWSISIDKKRKELASIDDCNEILAEFGVFLKNVKSKIDKLGRRLKTQNTARFEELMKVTYALVKKAKSVLD